MVGRRFRHPGTAGRDPVTMPHLGQALLDAGGVPAGVLVPRYDRRRLRVGVVHLGVGGFHRAHQAVYLDDLMAKGLASEWAICGVGVLPSDRRMAEAMWAQDGLYTVVTRKFTGEPGARVIGAMTEYLFAPDDPEAVVERMADAGVRIVSLTITEGGYGLDPLTGEFDVTAPAVQADLRADAPPRTVFALVTEALRRRRDRGITPFAVLSCDNVEQNGDVARRCIRGYAAAADPALAGWIDESVSFPNSMVDRITPATTEADRADFAERYGFLDQWPVFCEPFSQWVLEDVVPAQLRPPLEEVGVQLAADVTTYEAMKLRLLNAGHQALGYLGMLAGHVLVHDAAADLPLARFLRAYLEEATPTLLPVPGIDLADYRDEVVLRFANPGIGDRLERICAFGSDRMPKFVLPALLDNVRAGRTVRCGALVVAGWAAFVRAAGGSLVDARAEDLRRSADAGEPADFVRDQAIFGELADEPEFVTAYLQAVALLDRLGAQGAAQAVASDTA